MSFSDLVKVSVFMVGQNIGSNEFLMELEERMCKKYPKDIDPAHLMKLCKSTSKHYFLFNDMALFKMLEADCIKYIKHLSN